MGAGRREFIRRGTLAAGAVAGLGYLYVAHYASCVPNAGPFQEYKGRDDSLPVASESSTLRSVNGKLTVPTGPGLGVAIDPAFVKTAATLT